MEQESVNRSVTRLVVDQLAAWPLARDNFLALGKVQVKEYHVAGQTYRVQFNPARIRSTAARTDACSIGQRPCFLCANHRPQEQSSVSFLGRYDILLNPFPIFRVHLTIADRTHCPQRLSDRVPDMLAMARALPEYTIFYNGPACGASAPDHAHFQAGLRGYMPIETEWRTYGGQAYPTDGVTLYLTADSPRNAIVLTGSDETKLALCIDRLLGILPIADGEAEPRVNVLAMYDPGLYTVIVIRRRCHRPSCFFAEGDAHLMVSPAAVDLSGLFIVPTATDYARLDGGRIAEIVAEVCDAPLSAADLSHLISPQP